MNKKEFGNKKIAILITGEIRLPNKDNLLNSIDKFDTYISTYKEYKTSANLLSGNVQIYERDEVTDFIKSDLSLLDKYVKPKITSNIYQWWHLNNLLTIHKKTLLNYDIIFKTRSDCYFLHPLSPKMFDHVDERFFYMNSDISFYSSTYIFFKLYENFYRDILEKYLYKNERYFEINYHHLYNSLKFSFLKKNPFKILSILSKHDVVREGFFNGLDVNLFPHMIYSPRKRKLMQNIENFIISNNINELGGPYLRKNKPGTLEFGSERYNTLNAINKSIVLPFMLPTIGIYRKEVNWIYKLIVRPILIKIFKKKFKIFNS